MGSFTFEKILFRHTLPELSIKMTRLSERGGTEILTIGVTEMNY